MEDHLLDIRCLGDHPVREDEVGKDLETRVVKNDIDASISQLAEVLPERRRVVFEDVAHLGSCVAGLELDAAEEAQVRTWFVSNLLLIESTHISSWDRDVNRLRSVALAHTADQHIESAYMDQGV